MGLGYGSKLNTRLPVNLTAVVCVEQFLLELGNSRGCSLLKKKFSTSLHIPVLDKVPLTLAVSLLVASYSVSLSET